MHLEGEPVLQLNRRKSTKLDKKIWKITSNFDKLKVLKTIDYKNSFKLKRRKWKYNPVSAVTKRIYQKYFVWRNLKAFFLLKRFKTQQKKPAWRFNNYYLKYKKMKINRKARHIKYLNARINIRRVSRLRGHKYNYKFAKLLGQKSYWRYHRSVFIKPNYTKQALVSWESNWINHNFLRQHEILPSKLYSLKKTNNTLLLTLPLFNQKNKNPASSFPNMKLKIHKHADFSGPKNFYKQMQSWIENLKLFPLDFLVLLKKWKLTAKSKIYRKTYFGIKKSRKFAIDNYVRARRLSNTKKPLCKPYLQRKIFQYLKTFSEKPSTIINHKLYCQGMNLVNPRIFWRQILANSNNLKKIYQKQYNISFVEQKKYVLENKYRDFGKKPPIKLFKGPRTQQLKYPWLSQKISKKRTYSTQYFNSYRCLRSTWKRKSNKIYRTFLAITKHRHERVKLKLGTRGGNRSIHFKLNLLKVILPFFGKLNQKQFKKIWRKYIYIKSHYMGREEYFHNKLNTSLCMLIQQLGWAPNTYWAQCLVKSGWISISKLIDTNQTEKNSKYQLFPLFNSQTQAGNHQKFYSTNTIRNPFYQLQLNEVVQIHPHIKKFCQQFFLRRLNWTRRRMPSFIEANSKGTNAVIVNSGLYYTSNTKDRNKKSFLRYILD